jgi:hypothetical protein
LSLIAEKKHAGGRPLKFESPSKLEEKGLAYFKECEEKKLPLTITGLALALDTSRETLCNYEERDEYFDVVKRLKLRVENYLEQRLHSMSNPAGIIFILKNLSWTDRQDIDINAKLRPSSYSEEEEHELREFAKLRALAESAKAITAGNEE